MRRGKDLNFWCKNRRTRALKPQTPLSWVCRKEEVWKVHTVAGKGSVLLEQTKESGQVEPLKTERGGGDWGVFQNPEKKSGGDGAYGFIKGTLEGKSLQGLNLSQTTK